MTEKNKFDLLLSLLWVHFDSGLIFWSKRPETTKENKIFNAKNAGRIAGAIGGDGYIRIGLRIGSERIGCLAHRLVYYAKTGIIPENIDHINSNRKDNRPENLRSVDRTENQRNMKKFSNNTSGFNGVSYSKSAKKWHAYINDNNGKRLTIGYFDSKEKAVEERSKKETGLGYFNLHGIK